MTNQQIQVANKFIALEDQDGEDVENNQLMVIEESTEARSPNLTGTLNPKAAEFTPKSVGIGSSAKKGKNSKRTGNGSVVAKGVQKESTAAWVNRTFAGNIVATNQSCQEIPSEATEFDASVKESNVNERLQLSGGKLWSAQTEEDSEEGELHEGASGEEESTDEEKEEEEQSVNGSCQQRT